MVDKYRVWDDIREKWVEDVSEFLSFNKDGSINCFNGLGDTKYFKNAEGILDKYRNYIYLDSSIFKFDFGRGEGFGYLSYCEHHHEYCVNVIKWVRRLSFDDYTIFCLSDEPNISISDIFVVDTIQENNLELINQK